MYRRVIMSAAAMAGRVGGPTYLSGSSLGTAGAAASLGFAASVDRDADEHAPSIKTEQANTDKKDFTHSPRKEEAEVSCRSLPRRLLDQQDHFERHIQTGPSIGRTAIPRLRRLPAPPLGMTRAVCRL